MGKVNVSKIKKSSNRIEHIVNKMSKSHSNITDSLGNLSECIDLLKSYNGTIASKSIVRDTEYKTTWVVNVSSPSSVDVEGILGECGLKERTLEREKEDLDIVADKLSNIISHIEDKFGDVAVKNYLYKGVSSMAEAKADFSTYDLSDDEILQLARLCAQEQGSNSIAGILAEASLIANKFELSNGLGDDGVQYDNVVDYAKYMGWWSDSENVMENGSKDNPIDDAILLAVKKVFKDGKRVLPKYVDQHDSVGDLSKVEVKQNGVTREIDKENPKEYVPYDTTCYQSPDKFEKPSNWTYVLHPDEKSDPFGYEDEGNIGVYGDYCYNSDDIVREIAEEAVSMKAQK